MLLKLLSAISDDSPPMAKNEEGQSFSAIVRPGLHSDMASVCRNVTSRVAKQGESGRSAILWVFELVLPLLFRPSNRIFLDKLSNVSSRSLGRGRFA